MAFDRTVVPSTKNVTGFKNPTCDGCGAKLEFVFSAHPDACETLHLRDAVVISIHGGYGMYVDATCETEQDALTLLLCKECADKERTSQTLIGKVLDKYLKYRPVRRV